MTVLDATFLRLRERPSAQVYQFPSLRLSTGQTGLLIWGNNAGREVFCNAIAGSASARHHNWSIEGEVIAPARSNSGDPTTVLVSRNPEAQLSGFFSAMGLECALPLALVGGAVKDQLVWTDFLLSVFGLADNETPVELLSTGQKQRLVIASSLASQPALLLVDGPLEFVDPQARERLAAFLVQSCRARGIACLICASDETLVPAKFFDHLFRVAQADHSTRKSKHVETSELASSPLLRRSSNGPVLRINELEYSVPSTGFRLYQGLSFKIDPGTTLALHGPNGSGKSTLARMIGGQIEPESGSVTICDRSARDWYERREPKMTLAFADPDLTFTKRTVQMELELTEPGPIEPALFSTILEVLDLQDELEKNPFDLDWHTRRRVSLAKAIGNARSLVFIDEPIVDATMSDWGALRTVVELCNHSGIAVVIATNDIRLSKTLGIFDVIQIPAAIASARTKGKQATSIDSARRSIDLQRATSDGKLPIANPWASIASGWLRQTSEFCLFWERFVYSDVQAILKSLAAPNPCTLVDLGCGIGLHSLIARSILEQANTKIDQLIGVDREDKFLAVANCFAGHAEDTMFIRADLTNEIETLQVEQAILKSGRPVIFIAYFSFHDILTLRQLSKLITNTKYLGGAFVCVLLSPEAVRRGMSKNSGRDQLDKSAFNKPAIESDGDAIVWHRVSVDAGDPLDIPYVLRDVGRYEALLRAAWAQVRRKVRIASDPLDVALRPDDGFSKQEDVVFLWTEFRPPEIEHH